MNEADAIKLLDLTEGQLLLSLGRIVSPNKHVKPEDNDETIKAAENWLSKHLTMLKELICNNEKVQKILKSKTIVDDTGLVIAVFSLISGALEPAIAALVSCLIVRRGLSTICPVF